MPIHLLLLILAFICFLVAAFAAVFGIVVNKVNLVALGLAFWVLASIIT